MEAGTDMPLERVDAWVRHFCMGETLQKEAMFACQFSIQLFVTPWHILCLIGSTIVFRDVI